MSIAIKMSFIPKIKFFLMNHHIILINDMSIGEPKTSNLY